MAAYAYTVTNKFPVAKKLLGFFGVKLLVGSIDITNYNAVLAEVTDISRQFLGTPVVVCSGVSDGAVSQLVRWVPASKSFQCIVPTTGAETADDVDVGAVEFIAIGI